MCTAFAPIHHARGRSVSRSRGDRAYIDRCIERPPRWILRAEAELGASGSRRSDPHLPPSFRSQCSPALRQTSSADIVARHGSGLEAYSREGGRWLPHLPVLVNEEFDLGLSAIGAGVAARNRMDHNQQKADALSKLDPPPPLEQRLDALRRCGLHAYFLLWGTDQPVLKLVVDDVSEADAPGTEPPHHVVEGARRPLRGADGWSQPDNLADEMLRLLEQNRQARVSAVSPGASRRAAE